jgi:MFS family permease
MFKVVIGTANLVGTTDHEGYSVKRPQGLFNLPRNVWAVSATSFFMDISSEMVVNILPLFLANVLGIKTNIIGIIEGVAESTASLLKIFSGWLSDKIGGRKWIAVAGYGLAAAAKPFFYFATTWEAIAAVRWVDRVGKGIRTAPRDALVADSVEPQVRGFAFGFQRAADTAGAMLGILFALALVWGAQSSQVKLGAGTFRAVVLLSVIPAVLAVLALSLGAREVGIKGQRAMPKFAFRALGKPFMIFMIIVGIFDLGNSSDAFLTLRAQERGMSVTGILAMLAAYNLIYALLSAPAGSLSDRIGRRRMIIGGWFVYAAIYLGFGLAQAVWHVVVLYILYGFYYALAYSTTKAMIADLVPERLRGTAFGTYAAVTGLLDFPASLVAGILWQGVGSWQGLGPGAPFLFGAGMALLAAVAMWFWKPPAAASTSAAS